MGDRPQSLSIARADGASKDLLQLGVPREGHVHLEEEAIQLRLGQWVGALHLERVLGGQDKERSWQRAGGLANADGLLLHGFEQR